jgi:hypothetical protein
MGVVEAVTNSNLKKKLPKMFLISYDGSPVRWVGTLPTIKNRRRDG